MSSKIDFYLENGFPYKDVRLANISHFSTEIALLGSL